MWTQTTNEIFLRIKDNLKNSLGEKISIHIYPGTHNMFRTFFMMTAEFPVIFMISKNETDGNYNHPFHF